MELLGGNEAVVRASINAGCNFFAAYPITPSSEIAHGMAELLPKYNGTFIQMEDEIASVSAVIGAAMTGATAMTATSGPGFSLMQESIGYAAMTETPIVIIDIMRSGPSTGMPTAPSQGDILQARFGSHGDYPIIVLTPATVADMYHLTEKAFRLAEKYLVPVIVMADEITAHMKESVDLPELKHKKKADQRRKPTTKKRECLGIGLRRHKTGLAHDISGMPTADSIQYEKLLKRLMSKIGSAKDLVCTKLEGDEEPEVVLLAYGSPYRSAKAAMKLLKKDGIRSALLKFEIIWPFPENIVKEISKKAVKLIVPEMNMGHIIREVERVAGHSHKIISVSSFGRLMTPETIVEASI